MKKGIRIILTVIGVIAAALSLLLTIKRKTSAARSISIIGGADGPTSIFLAGKIGNTSAVTGIVVGIILLACGIFMITKKK